MKSIFLLGLLLVSLSTYAEKTEVGEKVEPQCGEPCATCPGGIRKCDKTLSSSERTIKERNSRVKALRKNNKPRTTRQ